MITFTDIQRILNPIRRKLFLLMGRALLAAVNNSGESGFYASGSRKNPQRVQVTGLSNETLTDLERFQEYGFETYPIAGATAEAVLVSPDGTRDNAFVIMIQDTAYRPTDLAAGDVCLYHKDGSRIWFSAGKLKIEALQAMQIDITGDADITASGVINIESSEVNINNCDVTVTGGDVIADGITLKTHLHLGNLGGTTSAPQQAVVAIPNPATVTGDININGVLYSTHKHSQGNDSNGDAEVDTGGPHA